MATAATKTRKGTGVKSGAKSAVHSSSPVVRLKKIGSKYAVTIGGQAVSNPQTKAAATRQATALRVKAKANPTATVTAYQTFHKKGLAAAKSFIEKSKELTPAVKRDLIKDLRDYHKPPTIGTRDNPKPGKAKKTPKRVSKGKLRIEPVNGEFGVFVGRYMVQGGFKTRSAAEAFVSSLLKRKRHNPAATKLAADVGRELLKDFDVDHDGEFDKTDIAILEHFNDPSVVINDKTKKTGEILAKTPEGGIVVKWADGRTSVEDKDQLVKINGFRAWRMRRKAVKAYGKHLKHKAKAQAAKKKQRDTERGINARRPVLSKNPARIKISDILQSNGEQTIKGTIAELKGKGVKPRAAQKHKPITVVRSAGGKYIITDGFHRTALNIMLGRTTIEANVRKANPVDQKDLQEFKIAVRKLGTKTATRADLKRAMKLGEKCGFTQAETWRVVKRAWNKTAGNAPKRNPGMLDTLATFAMGLSAAIDVGKQLTPAKKKGTATKRKKTSGVHTSSPKKKSNPSSPQFEDFQGRPSTTVLELRTPQGTPRNIWVLGRLIYIDVRGFGRLNLSKGQFYLCGNKANNQMYIGGKGRSGPIFQTEPGMTDGYTIDVGKMTHVVYETVKTHLGDEAPQQYIHRMGEEGGEEPMFARDSEGMACIEGGSYTITPEGIRY
jgi:hypothetical protein